MLKVNQEKAKNMKTVSDLVKDVVLSIWADDIVHDHGWFQNPSKPSYNHTSFELNIKVLLS